ncbi:biotin--[acetyl-CoA-carboxylase] ligase [bacterium]|nr:biotin--[acetyl-CoA-carboxylase] ligase [bacterium]
MLLQDIPESIKNLEGFRFSKVINGEPVYWFGQTTSTMDIVDKLLKFPNTVITGIIVADEQTQGRGRYGKIWTSNIGGLYFSWLIKAEDNLTTFISELTTFSLVETLKSFKIICGIKLPNDIIYKGQKISGILIEKKGDFYNIGIGINVSNEISDVKQGVSMSMILGRSVESREEVLGQFINCFRTYKKYFSDNRELYLKKWSNYLIK